MDHEEMTTGLLAPARPVFCSKGHNLHRAQQDEEGLVRSARDGDPDAFGALVDRYSPRALAFARQMTGNAEDAQDLVQEAFVKAYRMLGGFKGESSFYTWFMKVLSNLCLDHLRRAAVMRRVFFFAPQREDNEEGWDQMEQVPDHRRSGMPDSGMEQRELRAALTRALKALPGRQRAVFLLKHDEGMKFSEVAAVLGITEGAVKAHMVRAVAALRKGMKEYGEQIKR
jgi:RNA polymerase sigma-70 factor (ECF subfamily)